MRLILTTIMIFTCLTSGAYKPDVSSYRKYLKTAFQSTTAANDFYKSTRSINDASAPLLLGFKAMSEFMMCTHVVSPIAKLSHFNKGKKMLEKAIASDSKNAELRLMRFCAQEQAPAMLNYNNKLDDDKVFLIQYLKEENDADSNREQVQGNIKTILLKSKKCTDQEKTMIKNL